MSCQPLDKSLLGMLQRRNEFNVGPFHIYAGEQLFPHQQMVVGHAHLQPHLMVLTNPGLEKCPHCEGQLPHPQYVIRATTPEGTEIVKQLGPFDLVYIRAGTVHSVEQTVDGAVGGYACIFPRHDENGVKLDDPKQPVE